MSTPQEPFFPMTHDDALALIAALNAFAPGLVTTTQRGFLAPDVEAIADGFIKLATNANKGLMSKTFAELLENPDRITFYANSVTGTAGFHNSIYRGKYLGTSVTAAQYAAISAGTFDDLFIGDYWTIGGVNWRIAAFDYWYRCGDAECTTHHVVIVPDSCIASSVKMNNTNITTGAYVGSDYYTGNNSNTGKATAQTAINNAFGSAHILTHREYLANAMSNGRHSAGAWYDSTFELMTEQMVYGKQFGTVSDGSTVPANYTIGNAQLPLFAHDHSKICIRAHWWLRDAVSSSTFAIVHTGGNADYYNASNAYGVRPAFGIRA